MIKTEFQQLLPLFLDLVRSLKKEGKTLTDYANDFTVESGICKRTNLYSCERIIRYRQNDDRTRKEPLTELGGFKVTQFIDHSKTDRG